MENSTHIIETALLLLIAFLIGCAIGWLLRTRFFGVDGTASSNASVNDAPKAAAPAPASPPAPAATTPAAKVPDTPMAAPVATAKPGADKTGAAKPAKSAGKPAKSAGKPAKTATAAADKTSAAKSGSTKPASAKTTAAKTKAAKATAKPAAPRASRAKPAKATPAVAPDAAGKPQGLDAPRGGKKDDLKRIAGVGPKLEGVLNGLGIYHFDQIASWDRQTVEWVDNYLSFKGRIDRDKWIEQSKTFADE